MKEIKKYLEGGIRIEKVNDRYEIYAPTTGKFSVDDLEELTPEKFEKLIEMESAYVKLKTRLPKLKIRENGNN